jgi:hypothetical protein
MHGAETTAALATVGLALLTMLLALATALLVRRTRQGIREQRDAAAADLAATREATRVAQKSVERQIAATYRPVLIDVARIGPVYPSMGARPATQDVQHREASDAMISVSHGNVTQDIDPRRIWVNQQGDVVLFSIPLRNVGQGLALVHEREMNLLGTAIKATMKGSNAKPPRVPAGETTRVTMRCRVDTQELLLAQLAGIRDWRMEIPYTDFVGGQPTRAVVRLQCKPGADIGHPTAWYVTDVELCLADVAVEQPKSLGDNSIEGPPAAAAQLPLSGRVLPDKSGIQRFRERRRNRRQA